MNTQSHISAFDTTLKTTHEWLRELQQLTGLSNQAQAYAVLRSVLQALRDRLPADEAVHLGAQLPMLIRGFYYDGWKPRTTPRKQRSLQSFLDSIGPLPGPREAFDALLAVKCVFQLLEHRLQGGELRDVFGAMPEGVREVWAASSRLGTHETFH